MSAETEKAWAFPPSGNLNELGHSFSCLDSQSDNSILSQMPLFVLSSSCISVGLPKTEANWRDVLSDLEYIESLIKVSIHFSFLLV